MKKKKEIKEILDLISSDARLIATFLEGMSIMANDKQYSITAQSHKASNITCWVNNVREILEGKE